MKNKKILIVDDEPNIGMTLEYAFKKKNFDVFIARDGGEALQILRNEHPDLVLPYVDGYQTLRRIRENEDFFHIKIVFLSAKNKLSDIEKGLKLGADTYFTKPFSVKKLVAEVTTLIN